MMNDRTLAEVRYSIGLQSILFMIYETDVKEINVSPFQS